MLEARRRRWTGGVRAVAAGFLAGVVASSCAVDDAAQFNDEALALACEIQTKCDYDLTDADLGFDPSDGPCSAERRDDFDTCAERCEFKRTAANTCIRRLERIAEDCKDANLSPCRRVYSDCDLGFDDRRCNLWACSVETNSSPAGALIPLGLLALGALGRRRRRRDA